MGEVLSAVGVNVLFEIAEVWGSFLGEIFSFFGEAPVLFFEPSSLSSFFFFIMASLELALTGAVFFLGDGLITSSDMFRWILDGLLVLPAVESVWLFLGNAVGGCFSSEPLRAWRRAQKINLTSTSKQSSKPECACVVAFITFFGWGSLSSMASVLANSSSS